LDTAYKLDRKNICNLISEHVLASEFGSVIKAILEVARRKSELLRKSALRMVEADGIMASNMIESKSQATNSSGGWTT
jgi:hypothetical protein